MLTCAKRVTSTAEITELRNFYQDFSGAPHQLCRSTEFATTMWFPVEDIAEAIFNGKEI